VGEAGTTFTGEAIELYRLIALKHGLALEIKGLRRRGDSCYSIVRRELGFRGNKEAVLRQLTDYVEVMKRGVQISRED
jgi:hypothetical protein